MAAEIPRPDRRRNPWRDDLASEDLRGVVAAPRFVTGALSQVSVPVAGLRREPHADALLDTEALMGETVRLLDAAGGWAWVQLARDDYVGYLPATALRSEVTPATHRVIVPATLVFAGDDIKTPHVASLSLNAEVTVEGQGERLSRLATGGFVPSRHIAQLNHAADDFVAVAEQFIGTPYLWGGKTRAGIDCSGLVQIALQAAGVPAPRDSDMQATEVGEPVDIAPSLEGLRRGDLVCWKGHIGIMRDAWTLLHANAWHMAVASEPLEAAVSRTGSRPFGFRRLAHGGPR